MHPIEYRRYSPGWCRGWPPGGCLYLEDASLFPLDTLAHPRLRAIMTAVAETLAAMIGTDLRGWARAYPGQLRHVGLDDVGLRVHCPTVARGSPFAQICRQTIVQLQPRMLSSGKITEDTLAAGLACFDDPELMEVALAMIATWGYGGRRPDREIGYVQCGLANITEIPGRTASSTK